MALSNDLTPTAYPHIYLDDRGRGWVDDTNVKVQEIVPDAVGPDAMTPAEMHEAYPHLSLAQIHAVLCYYYDHQAAVDAEMAAAEAEAERILARYANSDVQKRLSAIKRAGGLAALPDATGEGGSPVRSGEVMPGTA